MLTPIYEVQDRTLYGIGIFKSVVELFPLRVCSNTKDQRVSLGGCIKHELKITSFNPLTFLLLNWAAVLMLWCCGSSLCVGGCWIQV